MSVFLIDSDNLNSGGWIDEAFHVLLESEGALPVRRAYGSSDNLKNLADVLRLWAVRPFVNLALTKNTTDIALAVDAMELACRNPPPKLVVIGSGDADFLPLVVRLRERGIRMVCVSERSKMGREAVSAYDRVILVGSAQEPLMTLAPSATVAKRTPKPIKAPAKKVASKTPVLKSTATKKTPVKKATPKPKAPAVEPLDTASSSQPLPDVAAILLAVPSLQDGQPHALAAVAKALLDAKLRGKNTTATKLLKKFPHHFSLLPLEKPRTVTYHLPQEPV